MIVQFIDSWKCYFPGDIAGFDPLTCEMLIEKEIAIEVPQEPEIKETKRSGRNSKHRLD